MSSRGRSSSLAGAYVVYNGRTPVFSKPFRLGLSQNGNGMAIEGSTGFDVDAFLANAGRGRKIVQLRATEVFFSQGDPADCVFYLQRGRAKILVASRAGKEATIRLVSAGDFFGEKAMAAEPGLRLTTATALTACTALRIARPEFLRVMREEQSFSSVFSSFLLSCTLRVQADLVDQLFNRAEKRLARLLLLLAEYSQPEQEESLIPPISQEVLASMIGSTRPRVNGFMNRFRKLGFIEYNSRIRVHKSLLHVFLRD
jgi:CRP/FNR family transcriptional regulator, cyclic AMP receptor protein